MTNETYMAAIVINDNSVQFIPKIYNIKRYPAVFHYIDDLSPDLDINTPQFYIGRQDEVDPTIWHIEYSPTRVAEWKDGILQSTRTMRDQLLKECDWTQVLDIPFTEEKKGAWRDYRTALRDLPQYIIDNECYDNIPWPNPPQ
jgi:hypothetical protein